MSEFKVGDKVWVLCVVLCTDQDLVQVEGGNIQKFWMHSKHRRPVEPEQVKQFVIVNDQDGNQTLYVDGGLREVDNTVYGRDIDQAANGCAIRIESRNVELATGGCWPFRLNDLGLEAKQPEQDPLAPSPCADGVNYDGLAKGIIEAKGRDSEFQVGDKVRFVLPGHKRHGAEGILKSIHRGPKNAYLFSSDCGKFHRHCTIAELERIDKADPINPSHYKQGGIECIDAIKAATGDGFIGYVWGNVLKYLWRWPKKGGVEDLKKARWYLDRLIKEVGE